MKKQLSLENSMIFSLSLGIVIVIITLIVARPEPEEFTQIYIEDFQTLPRFLEPNQTTSFNVTINNLERKNYTYNYTLNKELYKLNYCNIPKLYISDNKTHTYHLQPGQIIKEDKYELEFIYSPKTLYPKVFLELKDKYRITLDEKNNTITFTTLQDEVTTKHNLEPLKNKHVLLTYDKRNLKLYIDNKKVMDLNLGFDATSSYFDFGAEKATFYNVKTRQDEQATEYHIRNTDLEYSSTYLKKEDNEYNFTFNATDEFLMEHWGNTIININNMIIETDNLKLYYKKPFLHINNNSYRANLTEPAITVLNRTTDNPIYITTQTHQLKFNLGTEKVTDFNEILERFSQLNIPEEQIRQIYLDIKTRQERNMEFNMDYLIENHTRINTRLEFMNITIKKNRLEYNDETYPIDQRKEWNNLKIISKEGKTKLFNNGQKILDLNKTFNNTPQVKLNTTAITRNVVLRDGTYTENFDTKECPLNNYKNITEEGNITVPYTYNQTLPFNITIEEPYDYAKISFSIKNNTQDVHFWVMDI